VNADRKAAAPAEGEGNGLKRFQYITDWEDLVNAGIEARKMGDQSNWTLGDLAAQVETTYGQGDLQKYAERIGVEYGSLRAYQAVAKRFVKRLTNLTWSHHQIVAARDDAEDVLAQAEREHWTVGELRRQIKAETPVEDVQALGLDKMITAEELLRRVAEADEPWRYTGFMMAAAELLLATTGRDFPAGPPTRAFAERFTSILALILAHFRSLQALEPWVVAQAEAAA
jgi:hypothetical protein